MSQTVEVGNRYTNTVEVTAKMIDQFAEMSGDYNPIHVDEAFAKTTVFGRRIAHGMLSGALISSALVKQLGTGVYLGQNLKFKKPVFIGDKLEIELVITNIRKEKGIATVETNVKKENGEVVVLGEAVIMLSPPKK